MLVIFPARLADVGPLLEGCEDPKMAEDAGVLEVVRQLDKACKEVGFFYVVILFPCLLSQPPDRKGNGLLCT